MFLYQQYSLYTRAPKMRVKPYKFILTYLLIYLLTYLLTQLSTVLLQKLTGSQLVKKLPAYYGTRRFITAFTSAHHVQGYM